MRFKMKFSEKVKYARMKLLLTQEAWQRNLAYPTLQFADGKRITANRKLFRKANSTLFAKVKELRLKSKSKNNCLKKLLLVAL